VQRKLKAAQRKAAKDAALDAEAALGKHLAFSFPGQLANLLLFFLSSKTPTMIPPKLMPPAVASANVGEITRTAIQQKTRCPHPAAIVVRLHFGYVPC
jgi:hypothetical protein